ncbi:MAG: glycosyltransferase family 92 protein [Akkermansia sp.]|nr:glycosyltransferase family 92 protein [Akkermansia sp.]
MRNYKLLFKNALSIIWSNGAVRQNHEDSKKTFPHELTFVGIFKNEGVYLEEWIEYHATCMGVSKFLIYDNESDDNTKAVLKKYIDDGLVEYIYWPGRRMQLAAYSDAIKRVKETTRYVGFFDIDEFLCPNNPNQKLVDIVKDFFASYPQAGGLAISWLMFGSNYHETKPTGLVMENYLRRGGDDYMSNVKTIGNPRIMLGCYSPHYPAYLYMTCNRNVKGKKVRGPFDYNKSTDVIHINHYFTKSKAECMQKIAKGIATKGTPRTKEIFYQRDRNDVYDDSLLRYVSIVKESIQMRNSKP